MCTGLGFICNFVTVVLSIISSIYWIASSSINIVEKDEFIILGGGTAEELNNALSQEKKENSRNKHALKYLWDVLKICTSRLIYDCKLAYKNRSLGILFHYNEINDTDIFSRIEISGLLNQQAACFAGLAAFCMALSTIISMIK